MPSASQAKVELEFGRNLVSSAALTDSGDLTTFEGNGSEWSQFSGFEPDIRPNGVISGCKLSGTATNDQISVTAGQAYVNGVLVTVSAGNVTVTREVTNEFLKASICVNGSGTLSSEEGTADASAHSGTRDAAGGPPLLATTLVELGQVHLTSTVAAPIADSEIKELINVHREDAFSPGYTVDYDAGEITFTEALMANHTSSAAKPVYAEYYNPVFSEQINCADFVPPVNSATISSTSVYNGAIASESISVNQGNLTIFPTNPITDAVTNLDNNIIWLKWYPRRTAAPHYKVQGRFNMTPSLPADDNMSFACTISSSTAALRKAT